MVGVCGCNWGVAIHCQAPFPPGAMPMIGREHHSRVDRINFCTRCVPDKRTLDILFIEILVLHKEIKVNLV